MRCAICEIIINYEVIVIFVQVKDGPFLFTFLCAIVNFLATDCQVLAQRSTDENYLILVEISRLLQLL